MNFNIKIADKSDAHLAATIVNEINYWAGQRVTGITSRTADYIKKQILNGNAIIAYAEDGSWAGFTYLEVWSHKKYVANSGLIVHPKYRNYGLCKKLKQISFQLATQNYPKAKVFGLTTSLNVMEANAQLGYRMIDYTELRKDEDFENGCSSIVNYPEILDRLHQDPVCIVMVYDPQSKASDRRRRKTA